MCLGVISDMHGNLPALEAVLKSTPSVDRLIRTGDAVGYNPWPEECAPEFTERDVPIVSENHDRAVAPGTGFRFNNMAAAGVDYVRDALSLAPMDWFSALSKNRTLVDGRVKFAHDYPNHPDCYTYPGNFSPSFSNDEDLLVLGHTHMRGHRIYDDGIVLNPGSIGQPRDGDPWAVYTVADLDATEIEAERVNYDIDRVAECVRKAGLPERLASRLYEGK